MALGSFNSRHQTPVAEINVVPLVDVMLVLLVIFIVTAPLLTHAVKIDLPKASSSANITKPEHVELALRVDGTTYWNGEILAPTMLADRLLTTAQHQPQPEVHIRADAHVHYEKVAQLMSQAAKAGLQRIGFVTQPE